MSDRGGPTPRSAHPADAVLQELDELLARERSALVQLDREAIEAFASRKLELDAALELAAREAPLGEPQKAVLGRVRQAALSNQLLLAHARSCVQGVLTLLSPANAPAYAANGAAAPATAGSVPPMALNLRG